MRALRGRKGETREQINMRGTINRNLFYAKMDLAGGFKEQAETHTAIANGLIKDYEAINDLKYKP